MWADFPLVENGEEYWLLHLATKMVECSNLSNSSASSRLANKILVSFIDLISITKLYSYSMQANVLALYHRHLSYRKTEIILYFRFLERFTHLALEPSSVSGAISQPPHTSTEEVGDDPLTKVCKRDSAESVRPYDPSSEPHIPDYPLLPLSRGCLLTLKKLTVQFTDTLKDKGVLAW